ncbi:MAG TPA: pseudomurein-binding repeat-containing protein [Methanobacterium sp.]|nr:pseudomurein-binding repeat-containing protein [Methanobacterium sp.]
MLVGVLFFLALTLSFNTGIIFATENTNGNVSVQSSNNSTNSYATSNTSGNSTVRSEGYSDGATSYAAGSSTQTVNAAGAVKTIKVLIYSGSEASINCVNGMIKALDYANTNSVIANVVFSYATSTIINSATLTGYDVLAMPGGSGGYYYLQSGSISGSAIRNFVASGKGYIGICAGAYAAAAHTDGYYDGWGIAPNVRCKAVNYEGGLPVQITSAGAQVLGTSGTKTLAHYNGPAMYVSGNAQVFATYGDGSTGYNGYAAIVGDYYGNGRVVLSGPHPELTPTVPTFVSKLIYWAAGGSTSSSSTLTVSQIATAANNVKNFYDKNKRLPNYVTTPAGQITMPKFLNLLTTATTQANSGSNTPINILNVNTPSSSASSYKSGYIYKSEFLSIAQTINSYITSNGKPPIYVTTSLGKINYNSLVYMYSKIMSFFYTNQRLPNYVSM